MSKKVSTGTSEDLAGLGSILKNISSRESASRTRDKIVAINTRAQSNRQDQWEKDQSSRPVVMDIGQEHQSNDQSLLPPRVTTPHGQSSADSKIVLPVSLRALTDKEMALFEWLKEHPDVITQYDELVKITGVKRETLRKTIARFKKYGWVTTERANRSAIQGIRIISTLPEGEDWEQGVVIRSGSGDPLDYRDRKTLSLSMQGNKADNVYSDLLNLADEDLIEQFPHLGESGFGTSEIKRLVDHWKKFQIIPTGFFQSLRHADWAFEHKLKDAKGNPIGVGYVYNALKRHGAYDRPIGYMSLVEKVAKQTDEEQAILEQIVNKEKTETAEQEFQVWLSSIEMNLDETVKKVIDKFPFLQAMKQDKLLRTYWDISRIEE